MPLESSSRRKRDPDYGPGICVAPSDMTDDFDFDFDVDRGRSASRTEDREPKEQAPEPGNDRADGSRGNGRGNGSRSNGGNGGGNGRGNGSRRFTSRAKELLERPDLIYGDDEEVDADAPPARLAPPAPSAPSAPDEGDWLSLGDDEFEPGSRTPLHQADDRASDPPTPGEARNFAKEARRRASRRPSPILDLDVEREHREKDDVDDGDFESMLERQPQKSGVARRGSAIRNAFLGGVQSLRRVGGERIAESRDRVHALRERVPSVPQPRPAGGDGKPPPRFRRHPRRSRWC